MILNNKKVNFNQINRIEQVTIQNKNIIDDLLLRLKNGEQSTLSNIRTLNEFRENHNSDVIYNSKNGSYIYGNYYIIPGYINKDSKSFDNLKFLNRAGFCKTSAPELVDCYNSGDNNFGVIVYKINDTAGGILLPYLDMSSEIPKERKEKFFEEQVVLLKSTSLYNPAVIEDQRNWCITPDTKNIYVGSWLKLEKCPSPEGKKALIQRLKNSLK